MVVVRRCLESSILTPIVSEPTFASPAVACPVNTAGTNVVVGDCRSDAGYYGIVTATSEDPFFATDGVNGAPQNLCDDDPGKCGCIGDQVIEIMNSSTNNARHLPQQRALARPFEFNGETPDPNIRRLRVRRAFRILSGVHAAQASRY